MQKLLIAAAFCGIFCGARVDAQSLLVMSAASYQQNAGISPGAIIALAGTDLADTIAGAPDPTNPPATLGGVTVTINNALCGLYFVSPTWITAVAPTTLTAGAASVVVQAPGRSTQTTITIQAPSSAAFFTLTGAPSGDGAILNVANYLNSAFSTTSGGSTTTLAAFLTSLDESTPPTIWLGGISAPLIYAGPQGTYPGMDQINFQVPAQLAGAGRVEIVVEQNGRRSNAVEAVVLPQQPVFPADQPNQTRSRELAAVAWVPNTNLALVADENDDVVRVVDLTQGKVTHVIALPDGAEPVSIGVHGAGDYAIVAERGRGSVALVDLNAFNVAGEFATGLGPSFVAMAGEQALIANSSSDTVSFFTFNAAFGAPAMQVTATLPVGRLPRAIAVDSLHAYVTNESAGTVTVLNLSNPVVLNTFGFGEDVRPGAIQVLDDVGFGIVAEPSAGPGGKLIFFNLGTGQFVSVEANPAQTGGASSMLALGDSIYLANQSGASITTTPVAVNTTVQLTAADIELSPANFNVDPGVRSLSIDSTANLLLSANEGTGTIVMNDLATNNLVGRIDALRTSPADADDHSDRFAAPNMPTISSVSPASTIAGTAATPVTLTIIGTNLTGAEGVLFIDPATVSSLTVGLGNVNRGNFGVSDPAIAVNSIQASPDGAKLTVQIQVAPFTQPRTSVVRVLTPNGETSLTSAPTFSVVPQ